MDENKIMFGAEKAWANMSAWLLFPSFVHNAFMAIRCSQKPEKMIQHVPRLW
jgi:hypothetical protein